MAKDRFARAFERLVGAFHRYHDAPRDPERVAELADARTDLDVARAEARAARVALSVDPAGPQRIEPGRAAGPSSTAGPEAHRRVGFRRIWT